MMCLGVHISDQASTSQVMSKRQGAAEVSMAKKRCAFRARLPFPIKMRAWQTHGQASSAYGCDVIPLNREVLHSLNRWVHFQVRRALVITPHADEGPKGINIRASNMIKRAFAQSGVFRLHHRVLRAVLKSSM